MFCYVVCHRAEWPADWLEELRQGAMEQFKDHVPAELQGVCIPSTWTAEDHRGTTKVFIYRANSKGGQQSISKAGEADIPRKPEWLGW